MPLLSLFTQAILRRPADPFFFLGITIRWMIAGRKMEELTPIGPGAQYRVESGGPPMAERREPPSPLWFHW